jgi:hypothetical protein
MQDLVVKLGIMVNAEPALAKLAASKELPMNIKFRLSKILRLIGEEMKSYNEANLALLEVHGTPVPNAPGSFTFDTKQDTQNYVVEINKIRDEDVTFKISPIPLSVLAACGDLTALDLNLLEWLIEPDVSLE